MAAPVILQDNIPTTLRPITSMDELIGALGVLQGAQEVSGLDASGEVVVSGDKEKDVNEVEGVENIPPSLEEIEDVPSSVMREEQEKVEMDVVPLQVDEEPLVSLQTSDSSLVPENQLDMVHSHGVLDEHQDEVAGDGVDVSEQVVPAVEEADALTQVEEVQEVKTMHAADGSADRRILNDMELSSADDPATLEVPSAGLLDMDQGTREEPLEDTVESADGAHDHKLTEKPSDIVDESKAENDHSPVPIDAAVDGNPSTIATVQTDEVISNVPQEPEAEDIETLNAASIDEQADSQATVNPSNEMEHVTTFADEVHPVDVADKPQVMDENTVDQTTVDAVGADMETVRDSADEPTIEHRALLEDNHVLDLPVDTETIVTSDPLIQTQDTSVAESTGQEPDGNPASSIQNTVLDVEGVELAIATKNETQPALVTDDVPASAFASDVYTQTIAIVPIIAHDEAPEVEDILTTQSQTLAPELTDAVQDNDLSQESLPIPITEVASTIPEPVVLITDPVIQAPFSLDNEAALPAGAMPKESEGHEEESALDTVVNEKAVEVGQEREPDVAAETVSLAVEMEEPHDTVEPARETLIQHVLDDSKQLTETILSSRTAVAIDISPAVIPPPEEPAVIDTTSVTEAPVTAKQVPPTLQDEEDTPSGILSESTAKPVDNISTSASSIEESTVDAAASSTLTSDDVKPSADEPPEIDKPHVDIHHESPAPGADLAEANSGTMVIEDVAFAQLVTVNVEGSSHPGVGVKSLDDEISEVELTTDDIVEVPNAIPGEAEGGTPPEITSSSVELEDPIDDHDHVQISIDSTAKETRIPHEHDLSDDKHEETVSPNTMDTEKLVIDLSVGDTVLSIADAKAVDQNTNTTIVEPHGVDDRKLMDKTESGVINAEEPSTGQLEHDIDIAHEDESDLAELANEATPALALEMDEEKFPSAPAEEQANIQHEHAILSGDSSADVAATTSVFKSRTSSPNTPVVDLATEVPESPQNYSDSHLDVLSVLKIVPVAESMMDVGQGQEIARLDSLHTTGGVQPAATVEQLQVEPGNNEQAIFDVANEPHVSEPEIVTDKTELKSSRDDSVVPASEKPALVLSEPTHSETTYTAADISETSGINGDTSVETAVRKIPVSADAVVDNEDILPSMQEQGSVDNDGVQETDSTIPSRLEDADEIVASNLESHEILYLEPSSGVPDAGKSEQELGLSTNDDNVNMAQDTHESKAVDQIIHTEDVFESSPVIEESRTVIREAEEVAPIPGSQDATVFVNEPADNSSTSANPDAPSRELLNPDSSPPIPSSGAEPQTSDLETATQDETPLSAAKKPSHEPDQAIIPEFDKPRESIIEGQSALTAGALASIPVERPKSPWTPSYSVTTQGPAPDDSERSTASPRTSSEQPVETISKEDAQANSHKLMDLTAESHEQHSSDPENIAAVDGKSLVVDTLAVSQVDVERPRSPWTPSYSAHTQGAALSDHVQDEQTPVDQSLPPASSDDKHEHKIGADYADITPCLQDPVESREISVVSSSPQKATDLQTTHVPIEVLPEPPEDSPIGIPSDVSGLVGPQLGISDDLPIDGKRSTSPASYSVIVISTLNGTAQANGVKATFAESSDATELSRTAPFSEESRPTEDGITERTVEPSEDPGTSVLANNQPSPHDVASYIAPESTADPKAISQELTATSTSGDQDSRPERPKSPWTPSYSVMRQGTPRLDQGDAIDINRADHGTPSQAVLTCEPAHLEGTTSPPSSIATEVVNTSEPYPTSNSGAEAILASEGVSSTRDELPSMVPSVSQVGEPDAGSLEDPVHSPMTIAITSADAARIEHSQIAPHVEWFVDSIHPVEETGVSEDIISSDAKKVLEPVAETSLVNDPPIFPTDTSSSGKSARPVPLRLAFSVSEGESVDVTRSVDMLSPTSSRKRHGSTASSRFSPAGWFSPTSKIEAGRASMEIANGEFTPLKSPVETASLLVPPPTPVVATKEPTSPRNCVIM